MNIELNKAFLQHLGISLSDEEYALLTDHIDSTLHERVITEITELLEDDQLAELAALKDADEAAREQWLTVIVPDLKEIIEDEIYILIDELAEQTDKL